jgi:transposase
VIANLSFELDKLRRYIFRFKSEKRNGNIGDNPRFFFELSVTQSV